MHVFTTSSHRMRGRWDRAITRSQHGSSCASTYVRATPRPKGPPEEEVYNTFHYIVTQQAAGHGVESYGEPQRTQTPGNGFGFHNSVSTQNSNLPEKLATREGGLHSRKQESPADPISKGIRDDANCQYLLLCQRNIKVRLDTKQEPSTKERATYVATNQSADQHKVKATGRNPRRHAAYTHLQ